MKQSKITIQFEVDPEVATFLMAFYTVYILPDHDYDAGDLFILDNLPNALLFLRDILTERHYNFANLRWDEPSRKFMLNAFGVE